MDLSIFITLIIISVFVIIFIISVGKTIVVEKYNGNPKKVLDFMFYFFFVLILAVIIVKIIYKVKADFFIICIFAIAVVSMISWRILLFKFHDVNAAKAFAVVNILALLINLFYFAIFTNVNTIFIIFLSLIVIWIISMTKLTYDLTPKQVLMLA
jgi:hypothetical protein